MGDISRGMREDRFNKAFRDQLEKITLPEHGPAKYFGMLPASSVVVAWWELPSGATITDGVIFYDTEGGYRDEYWAEALSYLFEMPIDEVRDRMKKHNL